MNYTATRLQEHVKNRALSLLLAGIVSITCSINAAHKGQPGETSSIKKETPSQQKREKSAPSLIKRIGLVGAGVGSALLIGGQIILVKLAVQHFDLDSMIKVSRQNGEKMARTVPPSLLVRFGTIGFPTAYVCGMYVLGKCSWNCFKEAFTREAKKSEAQGGDKDSKQPQQKDSDTSSKPANV